MAATVQNIQEIHPNYSGPKEDLDSLHYAAAERGDIKELERVGIAGANLFYHEPHTACTALHIASEKGHQRIVEYLLHYGARVDAKDRFQQTALHKACLKGHTRVTKALLKSKPHINSRDKLKGYTALHYAAYYGHKGCAESLIEAGCNVNAKCLWKQETPLALATEKVHMDIVQLLMQNGAAASQGLF